MDSDESHQFNSLKQWRTQFGAILGLEATNEWTLHFTSKIETTLIFWTLSLDWISGKNLSEVKFWSVFSPVCFHQSRVSKHRRPGSQGQLRLAGSNSGSQVDQRKHPGLQRRPEESDHFWLWRWSIVRQPAHPLALLRRYVCMLTGTRHTQKGLFVVLSFLHLLIMLWYHAGFTSRCIIVTVSSVRWFCFT